MWLSLSTQATFRGFVPAGTTKVTCTSVPLHPLIHPSLSVSVPFCQPSNHVYLLIASESDDEADPPTFAAAGAPVESSLLPVEAAETPSVTSIAATSGGRGGGSRCCFGHGSPTAGAWRGRRRRCTGCCDGVGDLLALDGCKRVHDRLLERFAVRVCASLVSRLAGLQPLAHHDEWWRELRTKGNARS